MGKPHPNDVHNPTILEMSVWKVKYSLSTTPRNIVFISGIPDPVKSQKIHIKIKVDKEREHFMYTKFHT